MSTSEPPASFERIVADVRSRIRAFTQQRFEQAVLRRDGHRCRICRSDLNVHAHHIEFLRNVCLRVASTEASNLETQEGRMELLDAILADTGSSPANGITLCPEDHLRAHSGDLSQSELLEYIANVEDPEPITNEKLVVREARSLAEVYSVVPLGALEVVREAPAFQRGERVGFQDFVGPPFRGKTGTLDRVAMSDGHVMVRFDEYLAVPGCRARLHFRFDPRMLTRADEKVAGA